MTPSFAALLGFVAWTLLLLGLTIVHRGVQVLAMRRRADAWTRGRAVEDPPIVKRLGDAHANCLEMLPLFAAVILVAVVAGHAAVTDGLAAWFLAARIGQSTSHVIAVNHWMIFLVRFPLFLVQVAILAWWLWLFMGVA